MAYLDGSTPVSSKLALVKNTKDGVTKCRLILDCRVSGSNDAATKVERVLLPKCWDVLRDIMALRKGCKRGEKIALFVLDFRDAFYMLPLLASERKYFTAFRDGKWYVWERIAQGSVNGPNAFGRRSALTGRITQGFVHEASARTQICTDDPCTVLRGTDRDIRHTITCMVMLWLSLGWGLSFHKGQHGVSVDWIGYRLTTTDEGVTISIKEAFMKDYATEVDELLTMRRIYLNELQSFTGRTNHIACLLYAWRPFISELWGAIYDRRRVGQRIWIKQILATLKWVSMFMQRQRGSLTRTWTYQSWLNPRTVLTMILDASPYGLGGILIASDRIVSYFASPLTRLDEEIHGHSIGSDKGQQVWAAVCILVAMRTWTSSWLGCQ